MSCKSLVRAFLTVLTISLITSQGRAETFPNKPIRLVVGFVPGGSTDIIARLLAPKLEAELGQAVVVENRPGVGGAVAADLVRRSIPDGHTLLLCTASIFSIQPFLPQPPSFDVMELTPISLIATTPYLMLIDKNLPWNSVADLLAAARKEPGKFNFASSGSGTGSHMAGEMLLKQAGINMAHVPYKGAGQAMSDLIAGRVSLMFDQVVSAFPHIQGNNVRAIAVAGPQAITAIPGLPITADTAGLEGFDPTSWVGLCTAPGVSLDRVEILSQSIQKVVSDRAIKQRFEADGMPLVGSSPEGFRTFLAADREKWGKLITQIDFVQ